MKLLIRSLLEVGFGWLLIVVVAFLVLMLLCIFGVLNCTATNNPKPVEEDAKSKEMKLKVE